MASWDAVIAPAPEPPLPVPRAGTAFGRAALRRRRAQLQIAQRALTQCFGARSCLWASRLVGLGFVGAMAFLARPLPDTVDALLRLALALLSWCAGLAALSAAGPHLDRLIEAGRGLFENRGMRLDQVRRLRPTAVGLWLVRHIGFVALLVLVTALALAREPQSAGRLLELAFGTLVYVAVLAAGLALLAELCRVLGRSRGQALLLGVVLVPQLLSPAWPELPTIASQYEQLLDRCLGFGGGT